MKTWTVLSLAVALAGATSFAVTTIVREEPPAAPPGVAAARVPDAWKQELDSLAARGERLERELDVLRAALDSRAPVQAEIDPAELDRAVARVLAGERAVELAAARATEAAATPKRFASAKAAFAELASIGDYDAAEEVWKEVREAGLLDEVVAEFEARARANPDDPGAQLDLGQAYLQKIFEAGQGPEAGKWATKADTAFDDALELDPKHWEARFFKATSLSFWPPLFGKQAEAIHHFEILVEQQAAQPSQSYFAQTHVWLGNLYQQTGQPEKAKAAWQQGLALFPDNAELVKKLELSGGF